MITRKDLPPTPTLDRRSASHECDGSITRHSALIGDFLDWLSYQRIRLASYQKVEGYHDEMFLPISEGPNSLLHRYFEIDPDAEEAERRVILAWLNERNAAIPTPGRRGTTSDTA